MSASKHKLCGTVASGSPGCAIIRFDFPAFLEKITGIGGWKEMIGPDSRTGVDYWYGSGEHEAYINVDQGFVTVSVDHEIVFEGDAEQAHCKEE